MTSQKNPARRPAKAHVAKPQKNSQGDLNQAAARPDGKTVLTVLFGDDEAAYEQFIEHDVAAAVAFARKALQYHDALNELGENMVDPTEVVDEAIARLLQEKRGAKLALNKRLMGLIVEVVHEFVHDIEQRERRERSIEANVKDPAEEAGFRTIGEHVLDFWQPDRDDSVYEFIADPDVPSPAEIKDMKDRQAAIYKALESLPRRWRESFIMMAVSGWSLEDLALWRDQTVDEVAKEIRAAQSFLRERLREQGELTNREPRQLPHRHKKG